MRPQRAATLAASRVPESAQQCSSNHFNLAADTGTLALRAHSVLTPPGHWGHWPLGAPNYVLYSQRRACAPAPPTTHTHRGTEKGFRGETKQDFFVCRSDFAQEGIVCVPRPNLPVARTNKYTHTAPHPLTPFFSFFVAPGGLSKTDVRWRVYERNGPKKSKHKKKYGVTGSSG